MCSSTDKSLINCPWLPVSKSGFSVAGAQWRPGQGLPTIEESDGKGWCISQTLAYPCPQEALHRRKGGAPPIHWFMDSRPSFYASPSLHHSQGPFISHHSGLIQTPVQFLVTASTAALHMRVRADAVCLLVSHIEGSRGWVLST